jgi:ABC-type Fe3+/spermidine/putrescine transport system ATPase subunit
MQLELKHIQQALHVTVLYVTHDQEEALTMSDRVAVMRHGRIEQVGTPTELYETPANRFVADFLGESNFLDGVVLRRGDGDRYAVRVGDGLEVWGVGVAPLREGQAVTAAVRPERLMGAGAQPEGANRCRGVVREAIFTGDATRYRVDAGAAGVVTVKVPNRLSGVQHQPGEALTLAWLPGETRLFPREAADA